MLLIFEIYILYPLQIFMLTFMRFPIIQQGEAGIYLACLSLLAPITAVVLLDFKLAATAFRQPAVGAGLISL
jgi:EamA domain-containing membrane protein RarD